MISIHDPKAVKILSPRQYEVAVLIEQKLSYRKIGDIIGLSHSRVRDLCFSSQKRLSNPDMKPLHKKYQQ